MTRPHSWLHTSLHSMPRRSFLRLGAGCGLALGIDGVLAGGSGFGLRNAAGATRQASRRKLLHIVVAGGWDSALATDPVTPSKSAQGAYDGAYGTQFGVHAVEGKPGLLVGEGFVDALPAFAALPTAFVNGIFMEVSAHEIALNYMLSGVPSLSRSREYPSLAARAGSRTGSYPPHVVLGRSPPLGDTRRTAPPLQAISTGLLSSMLRGPGSELVKPGAVQVGDELIGELDTLAESHLSSAQREALAPWRASGEGLDAVYGKNLSALLAYTPEVKERYLGAEDWQGPGTVAGAFLALKAGLSPYVTVSYVGEFDTHTAHFARHLPHLTLLARTLAVLADDLAGTPDPDDASKTLAETTLVVVNSEFVRTPKLNSAQGTDHWQSGSALLLGAGVVDGAVVGRTGPDAQALGWKGGDAVALSADSALLPEHLVSAILASLGLQDDAKAISKSPVLGVVGA
ncbi:MAG: DUF1501 domain-containing protein [Silvanigrellales bacterium]|nr:DUF1501 domain-containing protein [Silvanigrellales bacterium]